MYVDKPPIPWRIGGLSFQVNSFQIKSFQINIEDDGQINLII